MNRVQPASVKSLVGYFVQVIACSFVEQPIVGISLTLSAASFHPFTRNKNFYSYSQYLRGDVAHAKGCGTGVALTAIKVETFMIDLKFDE